MLITFCVLTLRIEQRLCVLHALESSIIFKSSTYLAICCWNYKEMFGSFYFIHSLNYWMVLSCTMPYECHYNMFWKRYNHPLSLVCLMQRIRDTCRLILTERHTIDTITILQNGTRTLEKINGNVQIFKKSSDISRWTACGKQLHKDKRLLSSAWHFKSLQQDSVNFTWWSDITISLT